MDQDTFMEVLFFWILYETFAVTHRERKANVTRDREAAFARIEGYSEDDFRRRFRMHRYQFNLLVNCVRENLEPRTWWARQCAINSSGSWVRAELKIAATLRVLAGGSYLDASDLFAVSAGNFHRNTFWPTIIAICNCEDPCLDNVMFPFNDEAKLRQHEATFKRFQKNFEGTVAAGDGCAFRIKRPSSDEVQEDVQSNYTRKYAWAYGFILFCDGDLNIMSVEATHVASTNDAGMYHSSEMHRAIEIEKKLPSWAHVVLDEAFGCTDQELVSWSQGKNALSQEKDAFNYYLSAQRQSVERVFGVLNNRFGILWRPMSFSFNRYKLILVALCRFVVKICPAIQCNCQLTSPAGCTILSRKTQTFVG